MHSIGSGAAQIAPASACLGPPPPAYHTPARPRPFLQCFKQQRSSKRRVGCRVQCAAMPQSLREAAGAALLSAAAAATLLLPAAPALAVSGGGGEWDGLGKFGNQREQAQQLPHLLHSGEQ